MTANTLQKEIEEAVPILLEMARPLTWNKISDKCRFILNEIKENQENLHKERQLKRKVNDKKIPVALAELMPTLLGLYDDFYDINLHIDRATKTMTVIDFRYYPKSSLDPEFRQIVVHNPPMLHCKVSLPPWLTDKKAKFDINWEHKQWLIDWKKFCARQKPKSQKRLT